MNQSAEQKKHQDDLSQSVYKQSCHSDEVQRSSYFGNLNQKSLAPTELAESAKLCNSVQVKDLAVNVMGVCCVGGRSAGRCRWLAVVFHVLCTCAATYHVHALEFQSLTRMAQQHHHDAL